MLYSQKSNQDTALIYFNKGLEISQELGDKNNLGSLYELIGKIYQNKEQNKEAQDAFFKSLKYRQELGSKLGISNSYNAIGDFFRITKDYSQSILYSEKADRKSTRLNSSH